MNKSGDEVSVKNDGLISTAYDELSLTGEITVHSDIPKNVTARYITLKVTNEDEPTPLTQEIKIIQYPLEYIVGVPGKYATRDDFSNNTYINYRDKIGLNSSPDVNLTFGETGGFWDRASYTFYSKVYESGTIYRVSSNRSWSKYYLNRGSQNAEDQNNNRMYMVQITSTSSKLYGSPSSNEDG